MLSVGAPPLGVAHWWPKELQLDLAVMNQKELLERIQETYEGGNKERLRRRLLAQPYLTKLARDRRLGIKQLVQICFSSAN
ncbi:hypothetical protein C7K08_14055 [Synechococcus lacustris str. Tous]|uniref:Uncharacterized protein n=3 Tax=Synechococcus TaxID=1129 RepID=A0A2P7EAN2_9SYNE|nr:hypothetical protein C7K08_14055 [Synechococcus lacustris str. Tous]